MEAEKIKGSRRLLRLVVDIGYEKRQVVAGLADHYKPEELLDKHVIIVTNLRPRKFMGYESQGMILAACPPKGKPVLLTVAEPVKPGAKVC